MLKPNGNYRALKDSYLFYHISQKVQAYRAAHPDQPLYRLGIGDVSRPLCAAAVAALVFSNCWIAVEGLAAGDPTLY